MNRLSSRCSSNVKRVVLASIVTTLLTGTACSDRTAGSGRSARTTTGRPEPVTC